MKQLIILIGIFAFSITNAKSQDIHFSQMAMSPLTLNPALTGAVYDFQANVNYRNQWLTVGEAYQTISASADTKLNFNYKHNKKAYFAVGVDFYHDRAGLVTVASNNFNLHLATHIVLTEHSTLR